MKGLKKVEGIEVIGVADVDRAHGAVIT
jgi:hypothetical protein